MGLAYYFDALPNCYKYLSLLQRSGTIAKLQPLSLHCYTKQTLCLINSHSMGNETPYIWTTMTTTFPINSNTTRLLGI